MKHIKPKTNLTNIGLTIGANCSTFQLAHVTNQRSLVLCDLVIASYKKNKREHERLLKKMEKKMEPALNLRHG